MPSAKINIIANFAGRIWTALMSIIFVPIYLRYLGGEAYGIIGIFSSIQVILSLLDVGLSATLSREIARRSALPEKKQEMRELVKTIELPYWLLAILILLIITFISPFVSKYWVNPEQIGKETVTQAIVIMGVGFAFQWISNFYAGGLTGLQRQIELNLINAFFATVRGIGSILVLIYISQTIQAFLIYQTIIALFHTTTIILVFRHYLPKTESKVKFKKQIFLDTWRYAAGISAIGLVMLGYTQLDKIILSKMLSLKDFGYYTLAGSLATMGIDMVSGSVGISYFPKFSQFVALNNQDLLKVTFHQACQVLNTIVIPLAAMLAFFSPEILFIWTKNQDLAEGYSSVLTLIAVGMGINALMVMPYYIQLANGFTKLTFWSNVAGTLVLIPLMIFLTSTYGVIGGPITWLILNVAHLLITMTIFYRIFLNGDQKRWYLEDILPPLIASCTVFSVGRYFIPSDLSRTYSLFYLFIIFVFGLIAAAVSFPFIRNQLILNLRNILKGNPKYES